MNSLHSFVGQELDEYRLEAMLGEGGMASVYRAIDTRLKRHVAVKVIQTPFRSDSTYVARFEREAQAIAQLEHPNIITIYRFGDIEGTLYLAMQFIDGADLAAVIESFRKDNAYIEYEEVIRIAHEVGTALDYAHSRGVIHRDIKPHNIMINRDGHAVVTDFGLALMTELGTQGEIFGTPHYIAPEQAISSAGVVPQSDLYAFAVVLYEMLTNRVPFNASAPLDVALMHLNEPVPSPRSFRPELSLAVENVLLKALAKKPDLRYSSGAELAKALEAALQEKETAPTTKPITLAQRVVLQSDANPLPPISEGSVAATRPPQKAPRTKPADQTLGGQARWLLPAIAAFAVVVVLVLLFALMRGSGGQAEPDPTAVADNANPVIPPPVDDVTETPPPDTPAPTATTTLTDTPPPPTSTETSTPPPPPTSTPLPAVIPTITNVPPSATPTGAPPEQRVATLLTDGRGITTGNPVTNGEFEVEGYCPRLHPTYGIATDETDWFCTQNGQRVRTLTNEDFDEICRLTYNAPNARAVSLMGSQPVAYRWRCFGISEVAPSSSTTYSIAISWRGEDSLFIANHSSQPFPLLPLTLSGQGQVIGAEWQVDHLQSGECVAVWKDTGNPVAADTSCTLVGSYVTRDGPSRFWKTNFAVLYNGVQVATCAGTPCTFQVSN